jgi:hypothetical protein
MITRNIIFFLMLILSCFLQATDTRAVTTGDFRSYSTIYSIGIEWDISGDADHNTACTVQYRIDGQSSWKNGLPLYRVDFNGADMMAGSILFLEPGTHYEVNLQLSDPDDSNESKTFFIATEKVPEPPQDGRVFYVVPGAGGGTGTQDDPYLGITSAQAIALPGDTFLLGMGSYPGEIEFNISGTVDNHVVWKAWGNGAPILETVRINGDYIWLEGLQIQGNDYGIRTYNNPLNVVVSRNTFIGCNYCVYLNHGGTGWYIADNEIVGNVDPASGDFGGEGVELNQTDNHTVAYNSISHVADGVSYPGKNCDIFANDIFDVSDDGIEPDYGYANNRVWGNRISNAYHNGISFQPMNGAPWYILRNQVAAPIESALKFRDNVDRALVAHNTFVGWIGAQKDGSDFLINVQSNNNLYISMTDWYVWENGSGGVANWKTNLDYDGFDWGGNQYAFKWGDRYDDLPAFTAATGLEPHGIRIDKDTCFETLNIPDSPPATMPKQYITLKPDCNAVDHGVVLPNINDDYLGSKPDLGAYEVGAPLPHFGPRTGTVTTDDRGLWLLFLPAFIHRQN